MDIYIFLGKWRFWIRIKSRKYDKIIFEWNIGW
jgi:hypothetical protein